MKASDAAILTLCDALASELGADNAADFKVEFDVLLRRYRKRAEQWATDAQAADLLQLGMDVAKERARCHRSTLYRRILRAQSRRKIVARQTPNATESA